MSDGISDGYRMQREHAEQAKRMSRYGKEACYTCEGDVLQDSKVTILYSKDAFLNFELVIEHGKPVPQHDVDFCSRRCHDHFLSAMEEIGEIRGLLTHSKLSPAFRRNIYRQIKKILEKGEPHV